MGNSNTRLIRKRLAQECEDEIFTINTEVDEGIEAIKKIDWTALKHLDERKLRELRSSLQHLKRDARSLNVRISSIVKDTMPGGVVGITRTEEAGTGGGYYVVSNPREIREILNE